VKFLDEIEQEIAKSENPQPEPEKPAAVAAPKKTDTKTDNSFSQVASSGKGPQAGIDLVNINNEQYVGELYIGDSK